MPNNKILGNTAFKGYGDIFQSTVTLKSGESITHIPLSDLYPPEYHPFQVSDDLAMTRLSENIKQYGVREPCIARPRADNGYELLCGNRRKRACEIAGIEVLPVIIREPDDDSAVLVMIDSNLEKREKILPSERAWAYKMMMEALNLMAQRTRVKKSQLFRIIRLTELIIALLDKVDGGKLALNPAVELSYLSPKEQTAVAVAMEAYEVKPSLSQAVRLKKLKQDGRLTNEIITKILSEEKRAFDKLDTRNQGKETNGVMRFRKYFPPETSPKQMEKVIAGLLADWKAKAAG